MHAQEGRGLRRVVRYQFPPEQTGEVFPVRLLDKPFGVSTQYDKRCTAQQGEKTHV